MNIEPAQILRLIDVLLRALGSRILSLIALLMTFGLYAWAMDKATWLAFAMAGAFGFAVLLPVLFVGWRSSHENVSG